MTGAASVVARWNVPTQELLERLVGERLPFGLRASAPKRTFYRDLYFDTPQGELTTKGVTCLLRLGLDDRRWLVLRVPPARGDSGSDEVREFGARVQEVEPTEIFAGASAPARRLRAVVDPGRLALRTELETDRLTRKTYSGLFRLPQLTFAYDAVTARSGELVGQFQELVVRRSWLSSVSIEAVQAVLAREYGLEAVETERMERAEAALRAAESDALARAVRGGRELAVLVVEHGRLALERTEHGLTLPLVEGSGEAGCRSAMRRFLGTAEGQVRLLGTVAASASRPALEVWVARRIGRRARGVRPIQWFTPGDVVARVGSPVLRDPRTLAAFTVAARSELLPEWSAPGAGGGGGGDDADTLSEVDAQSRLTLSELRVPTLLARALDTERPVPDQFINAELSWLEFNARVLALAADPATPVLARVRFVSIVSTNLDEFFMVRVAGLKHAVAHGSTTPSPDGLTPQDQLDAIAIRLRPLVERHYRCWHGLRDRELPAHGIEILAWEGLTREEQAFLRRYFHEQVLPVLTPKALTTAPGHPFPHASDRRIGLAVMLRDAETGPVHYAHVELPEGLPRFVALPGARRFVPLEEVIRADLEAVYPGRHVVAAYGFRATRSGDLQLDEQGAANLMQAVEEEVRRRPFGPVVRIEVEHAMPEPMRDLLQRELRFQESEQWSALSGADVYAVNGPLDLGSVREIAALPIPELDYPPFAARLRFDPGRPVLDVLDERDVLVHHPYDSFEASVERFVREAAEDPEVLAIKLTLYRPGGPSAIADALHRAVAAGKDVSVFVELKARFDEELNIRWARSLERAGIHVVTGLVLYKTHAKVILVVRRKDGRVRRYAHIGTGNYNPDSARVYTDVGLFTSHEGVTADVSALFNELTGSSQPPQAEFRHLLVAPTCMLDRLLELIGRETEHATAGRSGRIRAKLNGLADAQIIAALYRASQAGVDVDLVVRGFCTLRPGIPGLSERIRVVSVLGRFLEHARIYHFANGGDEEYYIGSADWRPRNLRRRVELATVVTDPQARTRLDRILTAELDDPSAWNLNSDGTYTRRVSPQDPSPRGVQEAFLAGLERAP